MTTIHQYTLRNFFHGLNGQNWKVVIKTIAKQTKTILKALEVVQKVIQIMVRITTQIHQVAKNSRLNFWKCSSKANFNSGSSMSARFISVTTSQKCQKCFTGLLQPYGGGQLFLLFLQLNFLKHLPHGHENDNPKKRFGHRVEGFVFACLVHTCDSKLFNQKLKLMDNKPETKLTNPHLGGSSSWFSSIEYR